MYSPVFPTRSFKELESVNGALQIQFEPSKTKEVFPERSNTILYVLFTFKTNGKKCMYTHFRYVPIIKFKDYYSILFPRVAMYVWTERNKGFVSCSDFVGHGNSLSNILTFLLSYTELITLTALELAIGFLEGFCYLLL